MGMNSNHAIMREKFKERSISILKRLFLCEDYWKFISEIHTSEKIATTIFDFIDLGPKNDLGLLTALSVLELMYLRVIVSQVGLLEVPRDGLPKHPSSSQ